MLCSVISILFLLSHSAHHLMGYLHSGQRHLVNMTLNDQPGPTLGNAVVSRRIDRYAEYTYQYTVKKGQTHVELQAEVELGEESSSDYPVIFEIRQKKLSESWALPVQSRSDPSFLYSRTGRTLCTHQSDNFTLSVLNLITVTVSTLSAAPILFKLTLRYKSDFVLRLNGVPQILQVGPLVPGILYFTFPQGKHKRLLDDVFIEISSDEYSCLTVSVQDPLCPILDQEHNVRHEGYFQTMVTKAGMTIQRDVYPNGYFIVIVMHDNNILCTGEHPVKSPDPASLFRVSTLTKTVKVAVKQALTEKFYIWGFFAPLLLIMPMIIGALACYWVIKQNTRRECYRDVIQEVVAERGNSLTENQLEQQSQNKKKLFLNSLCKKGDIELTKKAKLYTQAVFIVAVFYIVPAAQLVVMYQRMFHKTGNQDMCFFNFHCARPLKWLSDFNHVYSNIGYILLGFLALFIVHCSDRFHYQRNGCGIPPHYGIFYALGWTIVVEGILSGSYHVCPNHSNFHHDTCFMYVAALLTTVKLYHARHPDTNATACTAFLSLAIVIVVDVVGEIADHLVFWVIFTILHVIGSLLLAAQLFYSGRLKIDSRILRLIWITLRNDIEADDVEFMTTLSLHRMIIVGLGINYGIAMWGLVQRPNDFGSHLLLILGANMIIYILYYLIMKIVHDERVPRNSLACFCLSVIFMGAGFVYFMQVKTSWEYSPAKSRWYNDDCLLLDFYDSHDLLHFLSAFGLFFGLMALLMVDDDLKTKPRKEIPVF